MYTLLRDKCAHLTAEPEYYSRGRILWIFASFMVHFNRMLNHFYHSNKLKQPAITLPGNLFHCDIYVLKHFKSTCTVLTLNINFLAEVLSCKGSSRFTISLITLAGSLVYASLYHTITLSASLSSPL